MYTSAIFLLASFATLGKAHFQLQFPPPRGVFVEDKEPTFCDGYDNVANRTQFPLSNGFFTLNSEHPQWSSGVLLASSSNPTSFDNFSQINTFFTKQGEGVFCIPLDFSHSNATGLQDGQNVTLQIVFDGGDGALYQCADLTLSSTATIPSSIACNGTGSSSTSASSGASTAAGPTSAAPPASSTPPASANNSARQTAAGVTGLSLTFLGIVTAMML